MPSPSCWSWKLAPGGHTPEGEFRLSHLQSSELRWLGFEGVGQPGVLHCKTSKGRSLDLPGPGGRTGLALGVKAPPHATEGGVSPPGFVCRALHSGEAHWGGGHALLGSCLPGPEAGAGPAPSCLSLTGSWSCLYHVGEELHGACRRLPPAFGSLSLLTAAPCQGWESPPLCGLSKRGWRSRAWASGQ